MPKVTRWEKRRQAGSHALDRTKWSKLNHPVPSGAPSGEQVEGLFQVSKPNIFDARRQVCGASPEATPRIKDAITPSTWCHMLTPCLGGLTELNFGTKVKPSAPTSSAC